MREARAKDRDEEKPSSSSHTSPPLEEFCASPSFIRVLPPPLQGSIVTADVAERRRATTTRSYLREEELYSTLLSPSIHDHNREGSVAVIPVPSFVPFVTIALPESLLPWILPLGSLGTNVGDALNDSNAAT
ncbi:uncharacterized protein [Arachis hypogaea]|uniref:uncharacterized protein isoform X2 n=1 Tax=Arachis hypogaea TaxID=3818 RepID=UPI000DECD8A0|nr:uncharacterized protein LOC112796741 isoform X2 [Arachis hypogaea]